MLSANCGEVIHNQIAVIEEKKEVESGAIVREKHSWVRGKKSIIFVRMTNKTWQRRKEKWQNKGSEASHKEEYIKFYCVGISIGIFLSL